MNSYGPKVINNTPSLSNWYSGLFLVILGLFKWIVVSLLKDTYGRHQTLLMTGMSYLKIKNETQVFYAKRLGEAYIEVVNVTKSNQKQLRT